MKLRNIFKGVAAMLAVVSLASCSEEYLDVAPTTNVTDADITSTVTGAEAGYYGVCRSMYMQYGDMQGYMFFNGEGWVQMFYGDVMGSDYCSYFWQNGMGNSNYNWNSMSMEGSWQSRLMWMYGYNLINQCNKILGGIDNAEGDINERDRIKAGVLTIRAHAYVRLLQCYAPRWQDTNNGNTYCIIIRQPGDGQQVGLSTMKEVLDQIYGDLDEAIRLYDSCGSGRQFIWEPDKSVAQGIYTRAALLCEDWAKAQQMAHDARQGYDIMTLAEYHNGFAEANGEYMWANALTDEYMYYWATGSVYGCNGAYATIWGYGAGAMNVDLYDQMDANDGRRDLYLGPETLIAYAASIGKRLNRAEFYNPKSCDPSSMNLNSGNLGSIIYSYGTTMIPNDDKAKFGQPYTIRVSDAQTDTDYKMYICYGAQYKFWGVDIFGTNQFPFMRAAEMLLAEAEAAYHNNQPNVTTSCLNELNQKRITGYNCTKTGDALLEEVRLSRRIELWGEGHSWFDLKRWNLPMVRRAWVANDPTSGNYPAPNAMTRQPGDNNGWRYGFPTSESNYNTAVDRSLLK